MRRASIYKARKSDAACWAAIDLGMELNAIKKLCVGYKGLDQYVVR
jgi:hypothetical protein